MFLKLLINMHNKTYLQEEREAADDASRSDGDQSLAGNMQLDL